MSAPTGKLRGISAAALSLPDSVTHGAAAKIAELNRNLGEADKVIDLSIGALDLATDPRIDRGVVDFIQTRSHTIHAFAPVKGFPFLLEAIAARTARLHNIEYDPRTEIMVTPGGIKGSLAVAFHTLLNPGDEVVIPVPNWPHYGDMVQLHGAVPKTVLLSKFPQEGLGAAQLDAAISERTALVILGDCINPTGKVYTTEELTALAQVIAQHNQRRATRGAAPIHVVFDCPYEAHVLGERAKTFAALAVTVDGQRHAMRDITTWVTGPGKTYGMHGDRIGYLCAPPDILEMAARVQVNLTSFASTYGQVATHLAMQPEMDEVARGRAQGARAGLDEMLRQLAAIPSLHPHRPVGGYFLFIDFSAYAPHYKRHGFASVDQFLLSQARVATLCGSHFAHGEDLDHFVRINCGRSIDIISKAGQRIQQALARLVS